MVKRFEDYYTDCLSKDLKELGMNAEDILDKYADLLDELKEYMEPHNLAFQIKNAEEKGYHIDEWRKRLKLAREMAIEPLPDVEEGKGKLFAAERTISSAEAEARKEV